MKIVSILIVAFNMMSSAYAQDNKDSAKSAKFVTVTMALHSGTYYHQDWKAYFSNGTVKDMWEVLNLSKKGDFDRMQYELRMLSYFDDNGYELISIVQGSGSPREFYFKRK